MYRYVLMSTQLGSNKKGGKTADSSAITRMRKLSTIAKNYNDPSKQRRFPDNIVSVGLANASLQTLQNVTVGVVPTGPPANVTMVTTSKTFKLDLTGTGTIDWGVGSPTSFSGVGLEFINSSVSGTIRIYSKDLTYIAIGAGEAGHTSQMTSLDVSNCPTLSILSFNQNTLTSVDVSRNTALTALNCSVNKLTSLDVSRNTALMSLICDQNMLDSLDVSRNTALTALNCSVNKLTSLDVSRNTALTALSCNENMLNSLDISKNTALTLLDCSANNLNTLDLSGLAELAYLYCQNNTLTSLAVSQTPLLTNLDCSANAFEQADADTIAADLVLNAQSDGSLSFENNTPAIDTTGADYDTLRGKGWTITPIPQLRHSVPYNPPVAGSLRFNQRSRLSTPSTGDLVIRDQAFTIEWFQYAVTSLLSYQVFGIPNVGTPLIGVVFSSGTLRFLLDGSIYPLGSPGPLNTWTYFAISSNGSQIKVFKDGVQLGSTITKIYDIQAPLRDLTIGTNFDGFITGFRWTARQGLYNTTPPTIPTAPLGVSGTGTTTLLLKAETSVDAFTDSSAAGRIMTNSDIVWYNH